MAIGRGVLRGLHLLPFTIPEHVKASKEDIAECYEIHLVGLASDEISGVVLDNRIALEQIHPTYTLALLPISAGDRLSYEEASFYAEYLSYLHELPALVVPKQRDFGAGDIAFLLDNYPPEDTRLAYLRELIPALEIVAELRWGPLGVIYTVFPRIDDLVYLTPRIDFESVVEELHLYASALRQLDVGSEYLNYYRVIEAVSRSNGVAWMEENLPQLEDYEFHMILGSGDTEVSLLQPINVVDLMKQRAIDLLREHENAERFARHLYNVRNGIAHGRRIQRMDTAIGFGQVYRALYAIKLLARMGIEEKRAGHIT